MPASASRSRVYIVWLLSRLRGSLSRLSRSWASAWSSHSRLTWSSVCPLAKAFPRNIALMPPAEVPDAMSTRNRVRRVPSGAARQFPVDPLGSAQLRIADDQFAVRVHRRGPNQVEKLLRHSVDVDRQRRAAVQHQRKANFLLKSRRVGGHLPAVQQTSAESAAVTIAYVGSSKRLLTICPPRTSIPPAAPCGSADSEDGWG